MFRKKNKQKEEFKYSIENATSRELFDKQCKALEEGLIDLVKDYLSVDDDDGSLMQFYFYRDMEVTVLYDVELEEVFVDSPFDVKEFIVKSGG